MKLIITLSDPHAKFMSPMPTFLGFEALEVLVSEEGSLLSSDILCVPLTLSFVSTWALWTPGTQGPAGEKWSHHWQGQVLGAEGE